LIKVLFRFDRKQRGYSEKKNVIRFESSLRIREKCKKHRKESHRELRELKLIKGFSKKKLN